MTQRFTNVTVAQIIFGTLSAGVLGATSFIVTIRALKLDPVLNALLTLSGILFVAAVYQFVDVERRGARTLWNIMSALISVALIFLFIVMADPMLFSDLLTGFTIAFLASLAGGTLYDVSNAGDSS